MIINGGCLTSPVEASKTEVMELYATRNKGKKYALYGGTAFGAIFCYCQSQNCDFSAFRSSLARRSKLQRQFSYSLAKTEKSDCIALELLSRVRSISGFSIIKREKIFSNSTTMQLIL